MTELAGQFLKFNAIVLDTPHIYSCSLKSNYHVYLTALTP